MQSAAAYSRVRLLRRRSSGAVASQDAGAPHRGALRSGCSPRSSAESTSRLYTERRRCASPPATDAGTLHCTATLVGSYKFWSGSGHPSPAGGQNAAHSFSPAMVRLGGHRGRSARTRPARPHPLAAGGARSSKVKIKLVLLSPFSKRSGDKHVFCA